MVSIISSSEWPFTGNGPNGIGWSNRSASSGRIVAVAGAGAAALGGGATGAAATGAGAGAMGAGAAAAGAAADEPALATDVSWRYFIADQPSTAVCAFPLPSLYSIKPQSAPFTFALRVTQAVSPSNNASL